MTGLIGAKSCRSCEYRLKAQGEPDVLMCRRYPPQVIGVVIPTSSGVQTAVNAFYPQVNPEWPCGEYVRSPANAAEELADSVKGVTAQ